jgi:hypothetical protein
VADDDYTGAVDGNSNLSGHLQNAGCEMLEGDHKFQSDGVGDGAGC